MRDLTNNLTARNHLAIIIELSYIREDNTKAISENNKINWIYSKTKCREHSCLPWIPLTLYQTRINVKHLLYLINFTSILLICENNVQDQIEDIVLSFKLKIVKGDI